MVSRAMGAERKVRICLWFDDQGEEAAHFYTALFADLPGTGIGAISRKPDGSALVVEFALGDVGFQALNGGPTFVLSEACSISIACEDQAEIDRLWTALVADGGEESQCGWLRDRFGLSWQITPRAMGAMMSDPDPARVQRVVAAFMPMKKLELAVLEAAYRGE